MEVLPSPEALEHYLVKSTRSRVLVPTMGALHEGHCSLLDLARASRPTFDLVATIFVNPTQFGPNEDFDAYPRPMEADLEKCRSHGVDAVFTPVAAEMYAADASINIHEASLSHRLCGASRPGHFDGVCTVVAKLFNLTQASAAVFGEKDFQQLAVIRRMVRDLNFPLEIIPGPTVRESDGLAMSSRNTYLTEQQRSEAPVLFRALTEVAAAISEGKLDSPGTAKSQVTEAISSCKEANIDYVDIVDASSLVSLDEFTDKNVRLLTATYFGKTRLIDNVGLPSSKAGS
jgi:pantoate--beta-alanine ligase